MCFVFIVFMRTTTFAFGCHHLSFADVAAADAIYVHLAYVNNNNNKSRIRLLLIRRSTSSHRPSPPPLSLFPLPLKLKIIFSCTTSSSSLPPQQLMRPSLSRPQVVILATSPPPTPSSCYPYKVIPCHLWPSLPLMIDMLLHHHLLTSSPSTVIIFLFCCCCCFSSLQLALALPFTVVVVITDIIFGTAMSLSSCQLPPLL